MTQKLHIYSHFLEALANKEIDILDDELKIMLVSSSYTPNIHTDKYKSNITGEINGEGYTLGGLTLKNVKYTTSNGIATLKADNPRWTDLNIDNLKYAVIYDNTPFTSSSNLDTAKSLIAYIDYGKPLNVINAELEVEWNIDGIIKLIIN